MSSAKKSKISKPKTAQKQSEKLGEVIGKRKLLIGSLLLLLGVLFAVAIVDYSPMQDVFFRNSILKSFVVTTYEPPSNACGPFGATFCALSLNVIGAATIWLICYILWVGFLCFKRGSNPFAPASLIAMFASLILIASMGSALEVFKNAEIVSTSIFTAGWGGKIGSSIYIYLLHPCLNFFASILLLIVLISFCLIVILAQNPAMLAEDLVDSLRKTPSLLGKIFTLIGAIVLFLPKLIFKRKLKQNDDDDSETQFIVKPQKPVTAPISTFQEEEEEEADFSEDDADEIEKYLQAAAIDFEAEEEEANREVDIPEPFEDNEEENFTPNVVTFEEPSPKKTAAKEPETKGFKVSHIEEEEYKAPEPKKQKGDYVFPSIDLLAPAPKDTEDASENYQDRMDHIIETLQTFKIGVTPYEAVVGPVITRYEVRPKAGVKISSISSLEDDIALGLKVPKVRVTVTDRGTIGIEVPNKVRKNVCMRDIIESKEWNESKAEIPVVMGKDVTGKPVVLNLAKMPHALIAGSTGSGKSVCINTIIASLLYHSTPDDLRFIMVDPKMVELQIYNTLPHMLVPVVTDPRKVPAALKWLITEMMKRFAIFQKCGVRNIAGFNAKLLKDKEEQQRAAEMDAEMTPEERTMSLENNPEVDEVADEAEIPTSKLPYIVCIIDELADLMMVAGKEVEGSIARLTQLARAAGIHLLVATQRPSTDVITGLIKSNLPTRIGFKVASYIDSRTILDGKGAETLIGWGDMLFIPPGSSEMVRAQGAFISDDEINDIVEALKVNGEPEFIQEIQDQLDAAGDPDSDGGEEEGGEWSDPMTPKAISVIRESKRASVSFLQRKLRIGYNRAASIMDELEEKGYVGPDNGPSNPREILM